MKNTKLQILLLSTAFLVASATNASYFMYKPVPYDHEPRMERNNLSTFNVSVSGGSSRQGYNGSNKKDDSLNIYGLHQMQKLGEGVPGLVPTNNLDAILLALRDEITPNLGTNPFAKLHYKGAFSHLSANFSVVQNLSRGFFVRLDLPVQKLEVKNISRVDQSSATGNPASTNPNWVAFLANFDAILARFGNLSTAARSETGIGDLQVLAGWTINNEDVETLDFFDATVMVGVSAPSAKKRNEDFAFSVAAGHDGHVGIPVSFDMALGLYEWVTLGAHVGATFFINKTKTMRLTTSPYQSGFITLGKGDAKRDLGHIWNVGTFLKADHLFKGLSLMFSYDFTKQDESTVTPSDTVKFQSNFANMDLKLKSWTRHDIHFSAEYDFSSEGARFNPRVGMFFSMPVGGKRVFKPMSIGGFGGLSMVWDL